MFIPSPVTVDTKLKTADAHRYERMNIMNRIDICFDELKKNDKKALITFVTAGDPDMTATERAVLDMFENGADIVEIGVPFSDPIAEAPCVQQASLRSLAGGTTLDRVFECVESIRQKTDKPLVLMMYLNTIFVYGCEKFFRLCSEKGIDGVIVPDMPFEEHEEILPYADKYGIYNISFISAASGSRIRKIAQAAKGYICCVSNRKIDDYESYFSVIRENAACPFCACFGASSADDVKKLSPYCDGVISDNAIVDIMAKDPSAVGGFVKSLA